MTSTAKYSFDSPTYQPAGTGKKKKHRSSSRNKNVQAEAEDVDPLDGSGSLTYSAASSINSAAGESTDSSFADMMRVLDVQDSGELASILRAERARQDSRREDRSVAADSQQSSLAYSTDAESHLRSLATDAESALHGTGYLSTVPGQPSDQYSDVGRAPDVTPPRESTNMEADHALLFAPAEHTDSMKRRKDRRRKERQERTPRTKNSSKQTTPTKASHHNNHSITVESRQGTPPTARPPKAMLYEKDEEEDVWYAKWWMFCFPDAVRSMTPKR